MEIRSERRKIKDLIFYFSSISGKIFALVLILTPWLANAQEKSDLVDAAAMAKKLQDPLANITAVMSDNDFLFKTGQDDLSYSSSIQPVKALSFDKAGFNLVARTVIPILGLAPEAQKPPNIGEPIPAGNSITWGLSDILTQFFFSPKTEGVWKWGAGPMFSLKTHTNNKLAGPGWGSGPVGVLVGGAGDFSFAFIGGHLSGFNGNFSTSIFQPMVFYNFTNAPGWALSYNNQLSYNWKGSSGNEWTVPLGIGASKTMSLANEHGLELGVGPYWNVVRPKGAASMLLRFNINFVFP